MSIEDILNALPSREEIAAAAGLQPQASATRDILTTVGIFGTGMMLGAGLALLFAPKPGHEMRHDITEKIAELGEHLHAYAPSQTKEPTA